MPTIISLILAYLIGSISGALLIAKIFGLADPRTQGSGNAGATNMLRNAGKKMAIFVLLIDFFKGLFAVWLGIIFGCSNFMLGLVAFTVVLGHVFPVFFQFKGGKGVATALGALLALSMWVGLLVLAVWLLVAYFSRYSSLSSLVAATLAPIFILFSSHAVFFFGAVLISALIIFKHIGNIERLRNGTEGKINT